ncbi:Rne/Rng family ribonuclease [bacterium]|nr:Rne/Rng family ribonuclease [bacterium]
MGMLRKETKNIILIEVDADEKRAAYLRGNDVQELIIERTEEPARIGDIYYGKVSGVNDAIHAAFVDIGVGRNCFLPFSDYPEKMKKGDRVFVQIAKDEIKTKPARLTGYISVPGRFLIFMPNSQRGGVSKNITERQERLRLKKTMEDLKSSFGGAWISRTQASGRPEKEIISDGTFLAAVWKEIEIEKSKDIKTGPVYCMQDFTPKIIREMLNDKTNAVYVEPDAEFEKAKMYLKRIAPDQKAVLAANSENRSLFEIYGVEKVIRNLTKPSVSLPSGGEIVIQSTEALTAIDVNSKGFKKKGSVESTSFLTNKEAAKEIMRQIRIRNIGGIIVCDLIDMEKSLHKQEIYDIMKEEASFDRAKIDILPLNRLGLVEITRQRLEDNILEKVSVKCSHCDGSGRVLSPLTMLIRIKRHLMKNKNNLQGVSVNIFVHPTVADMFTEEAIDALSLATGKRIRMRADYKISEQEYEIE